MTVVLTIGSHAVELHDPYGFLVTRDGHPVPPQVHPPALLTFASKHHARECAAALERGDQATAHRLIDEHGRWWA